MIAGIKEQLHMGASKKLVFWDWVGTLVSADFFFSAQKVANANAALLEQAHRYAKVENSVSYIPYAWTLVDKFHQAGYKQVIVSNGSLQEIGAQMIHAPFKHFDLVLTVSEFNPKPDRQMFDYALKHLDVARDNSLFIADSPVDEVAAKTVGLDFYKVDTCLNSYLQIAKKFGFIE